MTRRTSTMTKALRDILGMFVLVGCLTALELPAQDTEASSSDVVEEEEGVDSALKLAALVPLNTPIRNFRLPDRDENGQLTAVITADEVRRTSEKRLLLDGLKVVLYKEGVPSMEFTTRRARYDLESEILAGRERVELKQGQSVSVGRGFVFDGKTRRWSLLREVTTKVVLELEKDEEEKAEKP